MSSPRHLEFPTGYVELLTRARYGVKALSHADECRYAALLVGSEAWAKWILPLLDENIAVQREILEHPQEEFRDKFGGDDLLRATVMVLNGFKRYVNVRAAAHFEAVSANQGEANAG